MILIIDNYDSFTYNIDDYLRQLKQQTLVKLNDKITIEQIRALRPKAIIISPGPCGPEEAKISNQAVDFCISTSTPLLGVCLGMQTIAYRYGSKIIKAPIPVHGKTSIIYNNGNNLFLNLPSSFKVTRYHSLIIKPDSLTSEFIVDAYTTDKLIMAISHKSKPIYAVQYHPESICSEHGLLQFNNFLKLANLI